MPNIPLPSVNATITITKVGYMVTIHIVSATRVQVSGDLTNCFHQLTIPSVPSDFHPPENIYTTACQLFTCLDETIINQIDEKAT
jgi:hypothetical protein